MIGRRSFLTGLFAAPAIIRPGLLMPVKPSIDVVTDPRWFPGPFRFTAEQLASFNNATLETYMRRGGIWSDTHYVLSGPEQLA